MTKTTAAGAKFFIGPGNETANTQSAYEKLTWKEIGDLVDLGGLGDSYQPVTSDVLSDRRTHTYKGQKSGGTPRFTFEHDAGDIGQAALDAAAATDSNYAFRIELDNAGSGKKKETLYFRGLVMGTPLTIGTANAMVQKQVDIAVNSDVVHVDPS